MQIREPKALALATFTLGTLLATWAAIHQYSINAVHGQERFDALARQIAEQVEARVRVHAYGLRGARGAIIGAGPNGITRAVFRQYVASRALSDEFPGAHGVGFIRRVRTGGEVAFLAHARADDAPQLAIHPMMPGSRDHYVIEYLEPEAENAPALGYDIASETRRRAAADAALASGEPTLTAPITLVQAHEQRFGSVLLLLPVYDWGVWPVDHAARVNHGIGWTFAPLVTSEVLRGLTDLDVTYRLALHDVSAGATPDSFFDSASGHDEAVAAQWQSRIPITVFGRTWLVELRSLPRFEELLAAREPVSVAALGMLLTLLCARLAYTQRLSAQRAIEMHAHQARLARVVENASDAIVGKTLDGVVTSWNKAAERIFGYTAEEAVGRTILELLVPEERRSEEAEILERLARGEHVERVDTVRHRRDGSLVEVSVASSPILDEHQRILGVAKTITDITQKKNLERQLLELNATLEHQVQERSAQLASTRRDLENILDALPVMIAYWDKDQRCRFANRPYAAWFGRQPADIIGVELKAIFGARYGVNLPYIERALSGEAITLDREVPDPAGGAPFQIELHYLPDAVDGQVHGFYLIAHNVTEQLETRLRLAAALTETNMLFSVIHQHAIVSMADRSGKIIEANEAFCRISGYTREELLGQDHRIINSREHDHSFWSEMWRTVASGKAWRHAVCNRAKNGSLYWVDSIIAPFVDDRGRITKYISIRFDITSAKQSEFLLRESESLQRGILSHVGSAIIATDSAGTITHWNRAAQALLGHPEAEVVGKSTLAVIHDASEVQARRAALEATGIHTETSFEALVAVTRAGRADTNESTFVHKDGTRIPVLSTISTLLDNDGRILGYLEVAVDLSVRKQQERELVELNRLLAERSAQAESASEAKSMFLANMSHEIRTPLNAVVGLTYLLEQSALDHEQRNLVGKVKLASRSLLGVINNVLDLTKIEAGELQTEEAAFELRVLLQEVVGVMLVHASAKALELALDVDVDVPYVVRGDGQHLQQILTNLLSNAIKFTEHGAVQLSVSALDRSGDQTLLRFVVKDSGIGIDSAVQERIFAPFTQADVSTTRRYGGTGLGLSIVKRLVDHMGGEIIMTSELGLGSEFVVTLPFALDHRLASGPARPLRVLVAGGDPSVQTQVAEMIHALGWRGHCATTVPAAIECLRDGRAVGERVEVLIVLCRRASESLAEILGAVECELPPEQRPALVVASAEDDSATAELARNETIACSLMFGELTTSGLFNAVQEAVGAHLGIANDRLLRPAHGQLATALTGKHVLVVDDSDINLEIASSILGLAGARVTVATNGQEAVDLLRAQPTAFDAVLMDVQMPVLDGLAATRRIRDGLGLVKLPIVALTAGALLSERQRATSAGVDDFISKPFDPRAMVRKLAARLQASNVHVEPEPLSTVPSTWPALAGFDARTAFANLAGNRALFLQLLTRFFTQFADLELPLESSAQRRDAVALSARLHQLRGLAGTLGAHALEDRLLAWEQALRSAPQLGLDELAVDVARELARLRVSASPLLAAPSSSGETEINELARVAVTHPQVAANVDLAVLSALLKRQSFKALEVFAALASALQQELGEQPFQALRTAIENLQYQEALALLEAAHPVGLPRSGRSEPVAR